MDHAKETLQPTRLRRKADKLWSLAVRSIGHCFACEQTTHLQAHHIISRRHAGLRRSTLVKG